MNKETKQKKTEQNEMHTHINAEMQYANNNNRLHKQKQMLDMLIHTYIHKLYFRQLSIEVGLKTRKRT